MVAFAVISSAAAVVLMGADSEPDTLNARTLYITHDAIYIASDDDWAASGFPGDGTESDPYIISGYDIAGVGGDAINIQGTNAHFVIEGCYLHGDGNGIYLMNAQNGTLANNDCSWNAYDGIRMDGYSNLSFVLSGNNASNNGVYGIDVYAYPGDVTAFVVDCNVSDNSNNGMYVEASNNLNLTLVDTEVTWNYGSGIEAYADNGNLNAFVDGCNVSDNGWTGIYLSSWLDLDLILNNSASSGNSQAGGWSAGVEMYSGNGNLLANLTGCNLSYNGNEGIYAEAGYNLNLTLTDTVVTWNDVSWGFSCGIEAYAYGDLNLTLTRSDVSNQADQGIYLEADNTLYLTFDNTRIAQNYGGDLGGHGVYGYSYYGDIVAAMDGCNISENYDDGLYLEASENLDLNLSGSTIAWNEGYGIEAFTYNGAINAVFDGCNVSNDYYSGVYLNPYSSLMLTLTESRLSWNGQSGSGSGYGIEAYAGEYIEALIDGCDISNNYDDGIRLSYSEYSAIINTTCSSNGGSGMNLNSFDYGTISNNTCSSNGGSGISTSYSIGSVLSHNIVADNGGDGISAGWSSDFQISWNLLSGNLGYGVGLYSSSYDTVWNNTFLFNRGSTDVWDAGAVQAYDDGTNYWNTEGTPHGWGNFWSDWTTPDDDLDGIVDYPYLIDGGWGAEDYYPLATPRYGFAKLVFGIVRDQGGIPLSGADVIVTMMDGETGVSTKAAQTDSSGMYEVNFDWLEWDVGYTIEVTATYNSNQEFNSSIADASPVQEVDVSYAYAIPQFGSLFGFLLAGLFVGVLGSVLVNRGRASKRI